MSSMSNRLHPAQPRLVWATVLTLLIVTLASPLGAAPPVVPSVRSFSLLTFNEPLAPLFLDLLAFASDADGDLLSCEVLQSHPQLVAGPAFCTWIYTGTEPAQIPYRVVDAGGQASSPGWIEIRERPFIGPREGASGLFVVQTGAAQVSFQWLDLADWETRYEIHGGTSAGDADDLGSATLVESLNPNATSHVEDLPSAPPLGQTRYYKVWACDAEGCEGSNLAQVSFQATNLNQPPVAVNDPASHDPFITVGRGGSLILPTERLLANDWDPEGDAISLASTTNPSKGTLTAVEGGYLYSNTQPGDFDTFTYTISDGLLSSAPATVRIEIVTETVDAVDRTYTTAEGVPLYIPYADLTAGFTTARVSLPAFSTPSHGYLDYCCSPATDRPDGFWFVPRNARIDAATFYYSIFNNSSYDSAKITVNITETGDPNVADATVARPDALKHLRLADPGSPTTATTVYHFADFRRGGPLPDLGDQLRFATAITESGTGSVTFVLPEPTASGFSVKNYEGAIVLQSGTGIGANVLNYQIKGNDNVVSNGAATIQFISPPASGIFARNDLVTAIEGKATTLNWGTLTQNDYWNLAPPAPTTPVPDTLYVGRPRYGNFHNLLGFGGFPYHAPANFTGVDWFSYAIGYNGTYSQARVAIKIIPSKPTPDPESITVTAGGSATVDVIAGDTDPHDTVLRAVAVSDPDHGSATLFPDGKRVTYAPDPGFVGADTFTYTVQDPDGNQATGTVSVTVLNRPPVAMGDLAVVTEEGGLTIDIPVLLNDHDPDGDALTVTAVEKPQTGNVTILPSGALRYQLILQTAGDVDKFSYTVSDGRGGTATAVVQISIHCPLCQ
jgi:hypothetical protein